MKNFFTITALALLITSCRGAYETLSTPFRHTGQGLGLIGSTVVPSSDRQQENKDSAGSIPDNVKAYEIDIKAPPGSVINTAVDLFHKEARKVCAGNGYKHKITHKGTSEHFEYNRTSSKTQLVPSVKGYVICNEELAEVL